jgi:hypothetical protein
MPKYTKERVEVNIFKQTSLKTGKIKYRVIISRKEKTFDKTFKHLKEAQKFKKEVISGDIIDKKSHDLNIPISELVEKYIIKRTFKSGKKVYDVKIEHETNQFTKSFNTLKKAKKYKKDILSKINNKIVNEPNPNRIKEEKAKRLETNIFLRNKRYRVVRAYKKKTFAKTFDTLEQAQEYKRLIPEMYKANVKTIKALRAKIEGKQLKKKDN